MNDKVQATIGLITNVGGEVAGLSQHNPNLRWRNARRWSWACTTIAAYSFVIATESFKSGATPPSATQRAFFKSIEDALFDLYESEDEPLSFHACLPIVADRQKVSEAFSEEWATMGIDPNNDVFIPIHTILGVIFPDRVVRFQRDWADGSASSHLDGPARYAAMRLAAELTGIQTPQSLSGRTPKELGLVDYGSALTPLTLFAHAYLKQSRTL